MTKHFHVILWVPLLFCALFLFYWIEIYVNEVVEFEHFVLEKQLNYATDSAVEAMLVDADLDPDYSVVSFQRVDPQLAARDLAHTLCLDFGYVPTDTTMTKVLNDHIKTIIVAGYDGYYHFSLQDTDSHGGYELTQSPKIPYYYTDPSGTQFCLTLDSFYGYYGKLDNNTFELKNKDYYPAGIRPSDEVQAAAINDAVAETINWSLFQGMSKGKTQSIKIPNTAENLRNYQIIDSPTVICVAEGELSSFATTIIADGFAGSKIIDNDAVVAYTITSGATVKYKGSTLSLPAGKWYAYASWWEEHKPEDMSYYTGGTIYNTANEAAKEGYENLNLMYID